MISDAELLTQYRAARSNEVFARIVERHGPLVLRTCLRRLDNLHDAEDAAQDAFEALAQQADSIRGSLGAWLHGVAQHAANHLLRSRTRRVRREEAAASMRAMPQTALCEQAEWRDELDAALSQLPEPLREAVILRYLEGRKFDEAARLAGCPLATLSRRATEGINRLRSILGRRGMAFSTAALAGLLAQETVQSAAFAQAVVGLNAWALGAALQSAQPAVAGAAVSAVGWAKAKVYATTLAVTAAAAAASAPFVLPDAAPAPATQAAPVEPIQLGVNASLGGWRPFPDDSDWNRDVSREPVDPRSEALVNVVGRDKPLFPDFGSKMNGVPMGTPYVVVSGEQPKVPVQLTDFRKQRDPGPYPIPPDAPAEAGEPTEGFRRLIVLERDSRTLYELVGARREASGWRAMGGFIFDLQSNRQRPAGWTSADGAGLPIFPGLVRYDEVVEQQEIRHALRFAAPRIRSAYVAPARHYGGRSNDPNLPPFGMRVRLRADYDISGFPASARVILQALKTYGMFLAESGSEWYIHGTADPRWNEKDLKTLMRVKGRDFEVVRLGAMTTK
jgi:RNA polymerase sigma factor (sigma-70 family)